MTKNPSKNSEDVQKNTLVSYQYRDAGNFKVSRDMVLEGVLNKSQIDKIISKYGEGCIDGFVPSQIGFDDLQSELQGYDSVDHDVDHCYHEILEIEAVETEPNSKINAESFFKLIMNTEWKLFEVSHPKG